MSLMPARPAASRLAIQASISAFAAPPRRLTASGMGIDSITDQVSGTRPGGVVSIRFLRSATAASVQTVPIGTWCSAVTTSVAPACRTSSSPTPMSGPNQRQPSRISYDPPAAESAAAPVWKRYSFSLDVQIPVATVNYLTSIQVARREALGGQHDQI